MTSLAPARVEALTTPAWRQRLYPYVRPLVFVAVTLLAGGDLMEMFNFLAPLRATILFPYFHEVHDVLALVVVLYVAHAFSPRLGTWGLVWFIILHVPYALGYAWREEGPEIVRLFIVSVASFIGLRIITVRNELAERLADTARALEQQRLAERHRAEELKAVFAAMNDPVMVYDALGQVMQANPAALGLLSLAAQPPQEAEGHPNAVGQQAARRALQGETVRSERFVFTRPDGPAFVMLVSASPIYLDDVALGAVVAWHDVAERESLLNALVSERARLAAILRQMPAGVIIAEGTSGQLLLSNQQLERIWRRPFAADANVIQECIHTSFHSDGSPYEAEVWPLLRSITRGDVTEDEEIRFSRGDGTSGLLSVSAAPVRDREGHIVAGVMTLTDITERRLAELAVAESEQKFRGIFENAHEGILLADENGLVVECNHGLEDLLGLQRAEVIGRPLWAVRFAMAPVEKRTARFERTVKADLMALLEMDPAEWTSRDYETEVQRPDGSRRNAQLVIFPIRTPGGVMLGVTLRDVTDYHQSLETLRRYQLLSERTRDIIIFFDRNGQIVEANQAALTAYGYTADEMRRLNFRDLRASGTGSLVGQMLNQPDFPGALYETMHRRKSSVAFPVEVSSSSLMPIGPGLFLSIIRDITERKEAEQALRRAHSELEQRVQERTAELAQANTQLEARVQARTRELQRLLEFSNQMTFVLDMEQLPSVIFRQLRGVVPYEGAALLSLKGNELVMLDQQGRALAASASTSSVRQFPVAAASLWWNTLATTRRPIIIADVLGDAPEALEFRAAAEGALHGDFTHVHSWIGAPLIINEEVVGILSLSHGERNFYTTRHADLALAFANQAAMALENARLYQQAQEFAMLEERQRLARDLHDSVSQTLFSASLAAEVLPRLWVQHPDEGQRCLDELRQLTRGALAEMRTLLVELRPASLSKGKLSDLLRQLAEAITSRARVPITVEADDGHHPLPPEVQAALYRIAQEALNNIAKHARATQALARLRYFAASGETGWGVELNIQDDGRGFQPHAVTADHLGVSIMRERAQAIGAHFTVDSQPGAGTLVQVAWPAVAES